MPHIHLETDIAAPAEAVFDASIDVDAHMASVAGTGERAVAGVTQGRMRLGERVTWEARHFALRWRMTVAIIAWGRPRMFADAMLRGPFAFMRHVHRFEPLPGGGTRLVDDFHFRSPLGPLGRLADALLLRRHLERFLRARNAHLKALCEGASA